MSTILQVRVWARYLGLFFAAIIFAVIPSYANTENGLAKGTLSFERLSGGQYIINANVNGQGPFRFMIDTGATRTSVFEKTSKTLSLETSGLSPRNITGMTSSEYRPVGKVRSLSFAHVNFTNHDIIVLEDWPAPEIASDAIDGILGMDVLDGLILSFKHENSRLKIRKYGKLNARHYKRWAKINLEKNPYPGKDYGLMFTNTKVGSLRIPTMFDTGAEFTAISWNIVDGSRLGIEKKRLRKEWVVQGAVGDFKPRLRIMLDKFILDGLLFKKHEIIVMDFDKMPINGYGQYPLVITGVDMLGGHDFVLDLKNWDLYLNAKLRRAGRGGRMRTRSKVDDITTITVQ